MYVSADVKKRRANVSGASFQMSKANVRVDRQMIKAAVKAADRLNNLATALELRVGMLGTVPVCDRTNTKLREILRLCSRMARITRRLHEIVDKRMSSGSH